MNYGWRFVTLYRRQGSRPSPWKRNAKKAKWLSEDAFQIAVKRREAKSKGEKERYKHLNAEFQRIARRDKKAFLSNQCKEREENNRMGKTRDLFKKITLQKSWNVSIKVSIPHCLDHIGTSFVYCPIFRWKHTTKFKSALIPVTYFLPVNKCSECRCCTVCAPLKVAKEGQWGHFPSCYFWVSPISSPDLDEVVLIQSRLSITFDLTTSCRHFPKREIPYKFTCIWNTKYKVKEGISTKN